jgi:transposase
MAIYHWFGAILANSSPIPVPSYQIGSIFFLKTLDKSRDLTYTLCIMGIRAPIYIGFLSKDKREKNSLKNRDG